MALSDDDVAAIKRWVQEQAKAWPKPTPEQSALIKRVRVAREGAEPPLTKTGAPTTTRAAKHRADLDMQRSPSRLPGKHSAAKVRAQVIAIDLDRRACWSCAPGRGLCSNHKRRFRGVCTAIILARRDQAVAA